MGVFKGDARGLDYSSCRFRVGMYMVYIEGII